MFGPMFPHGRDENAQLKEPKPEHLKDWPSYILRNAKKLFRRLFYIYGLVWDARPWIFITMIFMTVFNGVSPVISAYISKLLLDALAKAATGELGENFWALGGLLIFQIAYQFFVSLVNSLNSMVNRLSNEIIVYSIKLKIMNKAKTIDLADFDLPEFYSKLENANREAGNRPLSIMSASFSIVSTLISLVGFIAILGSLMWYAPLLIILVSLPSAIVSFKYRGKMFRYVRHRSKDRRQMEYYSGLLVNKDLVKEVKLFNLADFFIGKYKEVFLNYFRGVRNLIMTESFIGIGLSVLNSGLSAFIFLRIARQVFDRILTVGDWSLYTNALFSISGSVSSIVNTAAGIYEGTLYIDNMIIFMDEPTTIVSSLAEPRKIDKKAPHFIEFKNCSFSYPGTQKKVLKNINLKIEPGQTIVLVGLNGAGKTTLLKLLTRLYDPTEGVIYFDGHDIREYDVNELYSVFGIIFQDFGKYAFTVAENIGFGQLEYIDDRERVEKASQKSAATEFIGRLNNGYDTALTRVFEENGRELSIGQWQKIAVARAFFRDSSIMILDEPTASLDPMAEQEIFNQFDELAHPSNGGAPKTTIFVSHRLSSATIADKIVVLEEGSIVEEGSHKDLIRKDGKYAELFNTQAKRYIDNIGENLGPDEDGKENRGRPAPPPDGGLPHPVKQ
ncbi:MAG: ABC transporter ATP-binding protein [Clostridia bacterium]|nr:ABC transporter ATP-binding protein [Clostridia bacterium]